MQKQKKTNKKIRPFKKIEYPQKLCTKTFFFLVQNLKSGSINGENRDDVCERVSKAAAAAASSLVASNSSTLAARISPNLYQIGIS